MTKAKVEKERIYECEVKRYKVDLSKRRTPFWKVKSVAEAVVDNDTEFRCKDCHGPVRIHRKHVAHGPAPHVEHLVHEDSEYCIAGMHFNRATDGRTHRISADPVR